MNTLKKKHIAILAIFSTAIVLLTCLLFIITQVKAAYQMDMYLHVVNETNKAGFDLNQSKVNFGKLSPGIGITKYFTIDNNDDKPVKAIIKVYGNIAPFVTINPLSQIITPEQGQGKVNATADVPLDATPGNYTGRLVVIVLKE